MLSCCAVVLQEFWSVPACTGQFSKTNGGIPLSVCCLVAASGTETKVRSRYGAGACLRWLTPHHSVLYDSRMIAYLALDGRTRSLYGVCSPHHNMR